MVLRDIPWLLTLHTQNFSLRANRRNKLQAVLRELQRRWDGLYENHLRHKRRRALGMRYALIQPQEPSLSLCHVQGQQHLKWSG